MIDTVVQNSQPGRAKAAEVKHRNAMISVVIQLVVCLVGLGVALRVYLYLDNLKAGAFWSHSVLAIGSLFFVLGLHLKHQGRGWMIGGMVLNILGLIMAFIGVILDAVQAGHIGETDFTRCSDSAVAGSYICPTASRGGSQSSCTIQFKEKTCYCCYIFQPICETYGLSLSTRPYMYEGVMCSQVYGEYHALLWTSMGFNILAFVVAIVAFALVANYRSMLANVAQAPMSLMMTQSLNDSYDGRFAHGPGPMIIFSQQQRVGYYPGGIPYPVAPPDYNTAMATAAPPVEPGSSRRTHLPPGMTPVEEPYTAAPYGGIAPPPYAP